MASPDKSELKERERNNWASAADGWRRRDGLLRRGAAPVTERMLELSGISSGSRLLDIASGTGEPAISAAQIVGVAGKVIGIDLVDEMLAVAREKAAKAGLGNIEFHCIDAETLDFTAGSFDAVTIRWGLMFMPEPMACLAAAHKALKPDGREAFQPGLFSAENHAHEALTCIASDCLRAIRPPGRLLEMGIKAGAGKRRMITK